MKKFHLSALNSLLIFVLSLSAVHAATEVESNDSLDLAQSLTVDSSVSVDAMLGVNDVDFYKFYGSAGDIVNVDIDNGIGGTQSVNTAIAIFDSNGTVIRANDDALTVDAGSISTRDSFIEDFVLPETGFYVIGVSNYMSPLQNGGSVPAVGGGFGFGSFTLPETSGDYTLVISKASASVQQVAIRIKPHSRDYAPIYPRNHGKIKVAILSSAEFNAPVSVDQETLTFGSTGDEASFVKCHRRAKDVNNDGYPDLVCKFKTELAGFTEQDDEGILKGQLTDGTSIEGAGYIKLIKRHHRGHRHHKRDDD